MTDAQLIRRVIKPALWVLGLAPLLYLLNRTRLGDLGFDPIRTITHFTGRTAITILFITLTVTPLRRLTGWNPLIKVRRLIGNFAFFYALIHFLIYAVFDRELSPVGLGEDIAKRPWITVGFSALLILTALAITSPQAMVRRLGGKRWRAIHRLVYLAAVLGIVHFLWSQKKDMTLPVKYAVVLGIIFATKIFVARRRDPPRRAVGDRSPVS